MGYGPKAVVGARVNVQFDRNARAGQPAGKLDVFFAEKIQVSHRDIGAREAGKILRTGRCAKQVPGLRPSPRSGCLNGY